MSRGMNMYELNLKLYAYAFGRGDKKGTRSLQGCARLLGGLRPTRVVIKAYRALQLLQVVRFLPFSANHSGEPARRFRRYFPSPSLSPQGRGGTDGLLGAPQDFPGGSSARLDLPPAGTDKNLLAAEKDTVVRAFTVARRTRGVPLPQWFGLDPWEFVNPVNFWINRGDERVHLEGLYRTSAGILVSLDWEQPAVENLELPVINGIACFCGKFRVTFGASRGWHAAWVLLQCVVCGKRWYCCSSRRRGTCPRCKREVPDQADSEPKILKLVCGKSHLVPATWGVWEEDWEATVKSCEKRFGWKRDRARRR
ncbi:uncharacterized protein LOC141726860 [Zonotrichia albicollis]|uniref:uncharacterized protein LOC141726859 n=1 Tax=Zonotrichia albicollis TaxID=44394 RepID=UPI003D80BD27